MPSITNMMIVKGTEDPPEQWIRTPLLDPEGVSQPDQKVYIAYEQDGNGAPITGFMYRMPGDPPFPSGYFSIGNTSAWSSSHGNERLDSPFEVAYTHDTKEASWLHIEEISAVMWTYVENGTASSLPSGWEYGNLKRTSGNDDTCYLNADCGYTGDKNLAYLLAVKGQPAKPGVPHPSLTLPRRPQ
ncbi:hypothetical protein V7793_16230 [Streptomyces sp. KLMMK]|uniref:hypothetical protein n=1 Tax=Streptomyces sp. KLMMK TaxID=3109353 RepID=UPI00300854E6